MEQNVNHKTEEKKQWKKWLFPPVWLIVLLTVVSGILLLLVFGIKQQLDINALNEEITVLEQELKNVKYNNEKTTARQIPRGRFVEMLQYEINKAYTSASNYPLSSR